MPDLHWNDDPARTGDGKRITVKGETRGAACLSDCLRGEYGRCAVDVLEVHGRTDHRNVVFSAAAKRENKRLPD